MPEVAYGAWSLLPPLMAIVLAITTRRVVPSLFAGIVIAVAILTVGEEMALRQLGDARSLVDWLYLPIESAERFLWKSLADEDHLRVFAFTMLMGAMVFVIQRGGGMHALVDRLAPIARSRRGGQLTTWLLGLIVFFDDYANTLLLGNTMRPLADRLKISREKLAYLVDSTAAPVSGLALISTWVAGEIGYINDGLSGLRFSSDTGGFELFMESIPYRFYVLFAILFVPLVGFLGRDFGPMLTAERAARMQRRTSDTGVKATAAEIESSHWLSAVIPICAMIAVTVSLLLVTGHQQLVSPTESVPEVTFWKVFSSGDSYLALVYGSIAGLAVAVTLARKPTLPLSELGGAAIAGARSVLPALTILWLAWTLSLITQKQYLGTGDYVGGLLEESVPLVLMPTLVFILASLVAFATGTSWGTMAILMPLVVPTVFKMLSAGSTAVSPHDAILVGSVGSVLAGAIFGDHCSPISDTTVLSSQASGCNHVAHVWTQLPYALVCGIVAILSGTLPAGFGMSPWVALPLGVLMLLAVLLIFGRRVDACQGA